MMAQTVERASMQSAPTIAGLRISPRYRSSVTPIIISAVFPANVVGEQHARLVDGPATAGRPGSVRRCAASSSVPAMHAAVATATLEAG
jgi:hypothetical protein